MSTRPASIADYNVNLPEPDGWTSAARSRHALDNRGGLVSVSPLTETEPRAASLAETCFPSIWSADRIAAALDRLLTGDRSDLDLAEVGLGYRLRRTHLAVIAWSDSPIQPRAEGSTTLRRLVEATGSFLGAGGHALVHQRGSVCWGWVPSKRAVSDVDIERFSTLISSSYPGHRIALGALGYSADGFTASHFQARTAYSVALGAGRSGHTVTSFDDASVRVAALLLRDLAGTTELVQEALGDLGVDGEWPGQLRETLRVYLAEGASFVTAAKRLHLHRNTVKYRVVKALEARGRPLGDGRLELELALTACRWFGSEVLAPAKP